jgi:hypothetical protein
MDKRHVINLQGREYVTYEGLLDEAHKQGLRSIRTAIVQMPSAANEQTALVTAEIEFASDSGPRLFTGIGDASPRNVSRAITPHLIRMAETRAKARAMRDGTNIGMTAIEELESADLPPEPGGMPPGPEVARLTPRAANHKLASKSQIEVVSREMKRVGMSAEEGREYLRKRFGKGSRSELTGQEIDAFIEHLRGLPASRAHA